MNTRTLSIVALALMTALTNMPHADGAPADAYQGLSEKAAAVQSKDTADGWAYIISGGIALSLSTPAFYLSEDIFARAVYTIGQTASVAAIGYGAYLVLIDNDYTRFKRIIDDSQSLKPEQKNELSRIFLQENARRARNVRKIRVISHGMTAALNFLNAATSSHPELRTALLFLGGVNTLAAINFGLRKSDDEMGLTESTVALSASPVGLTLSMRF